MQEFTLEQVIYLIKIFGDVEDNPDHAELLEYAKEDWEDFFGEHSELHDIVEEMGLEDATYDAALEFCENPIVEETI